MDARDLCAYNHFIRPAYVDSVLGLGWDVASKDRGAIHHRVELIALLWQMDVEPPQMTYTSMLRHRMGIPE